MTTQFFLVLINSSLHCGAIFTLAMFCTGQSLHRLESPFSFILLTLDCSYFCDMYSCFRYIYVPLGGSRHGPLCKMFSTGVAFGFVCLWHGGHDFLQYWALMNWAGVLVENSLKSLFASTFIHSIVVSLKSIDGAKTLGGLNYLLSLSYKMCGCNKNLSCSQK